MYDERKWHIGKRKNHGKVPKDFYDCSTFDGYQKMENSIAKAKGGNWIECRKKIVAMSDKNIAPPLIIVSFAVNNWYELATELISLCNGLPQQKILFFIS